MTSTNFCYFLQGYLEIAKPKTISKEELAKIKGHLRLAFRDDIDPSMGDVEHQRKLTAAHHGIDIGDLDGISDDEFLADLGMIDPITMDRC